MGAMVFFACGKVAEVPDAMQVDAPLDAVSCAAPMTACAAACVDTTSDVKNCGGCGIECQSGGESCQAGACVDTLATCANVATANPNASDGVYTFVDGTTLNCDISGGTCAQMHGSNAGLANGTYTKTDGTAIDCDMQDGGLQIIGVAWGQFDAPTTGYAIISLADFQASVLQQFFTKYYNAQSGATLIAAWNTYDCCFRYDNSVGSNNLAFGADYIYPMSTAGVSQCDVPAASLGALEGFSLEGATPELPPLGSDFFTTNLPQTSTACQTTTVCTTNPVDPPNCHNPAFFWKVMP
jgi:hypothetical protein